MNHIEKLGHVYDLHISSDAGQGTRESTTLYAEQCELAVGIATTNSCGGGFDCAGTFGSAGSFGGTLGSIGTFGCCC